MMSTALAIAENVNPIEIFTPQGTEDILARIKADARSIVTDISTPAGRDQIKSLAYRIARSKTYLDDMGKTLVADQKKQLELIDRERKRIRDELDALKEEIRAPLTEWEQREEKRTKEHESALARIEAAAVFDRQHPASADVIARIDSLAALHDRNWQEFEKRSQSAYEAARKRLDDVLAASQHHEAEQAELARLRREEEERKKREHEERLQAEAAEKARKAAVEKARKEAEAEAARVQLEREKAERERLRIEREKQEAEARARKAEADRKAAVEKAEHDRVAAEERVERERIEAAEKAKRDAEAAARREREKIEAERRAEEKAAAQREADRRHRTRINNEALAGLIAADLTEEQGKAVIAAVAKGQVAHMRINY